MDVVYIYGYGSEVRGVETTRTREGPGNSTEHPAFHQEYGEGLAAGALLKRLPEEGRSFEALTRKGIAS